MATQENKAKRFLRRKQLAARYSTCTRTIDRMVEDGRLPEPDFYIGKLPMWSEEKIEAQERAAMRGRDA